MEELNRKTIDRAVLVGLNADCFTKEETATETTLDELEALLNTAGGECAGKVLQNKHTPDPRSFIGEGKAEEVRQLVLETGANMVIFDNDLTPSQTRTLEDILKTTPLRPGTTMRCKSTTRSSRPCSKSARRTAPRRGCCIPTHPRWSLRQSCVSGSSA